MPYRHELCRRLTCPVAGILLALSGEDASRLEEVRIRRMCRTELMLHGERRHEAYMPDDAGMRDLIAALSGYSLYAYEREMAQGYLTLPGGHRAGICGRITMDEAGGAHMADVTSVLIRIARRIDGASRPIRRFLLGEGGRPLRVLLVGAPGCGKTTALRDAAIWLARERGLQVAAADEREELFPSGAEDGVAVDVLHGVGKAQAMRRLIRTMAPQVLVTDEIATAEDVQAIEEAARCGVGILASAHASSIREAADRPALGVLLRGGALDCCILLGRHGACMDVWQREREGKWNIYGDGFGGDGAPRRECAGDSPGGRGKITASVYPCHAEEPASDA